MIHFFNSEFVPSVYYFCTSIIHVVVAVIVLVVVVSGGGGSGSSRSSNNSTSIVVAVIVVIILLGVVVVCSSNCRKSYLSPNHRWCYSQTQHSANGLSAIQNSWSDRTSFLYIPHLMVSSTIFLGL